MVTFTGKLNSAISSVAVNHLLYFRLLAESLESYGFYL